MNSKKERNPAPTAPVAASVTGLGVAIVAISRFLAAKDPSFGSNLATTLETAQASGLPDADLRLLRVLIAAATPGPSRGRPPGHRLVD